MTITVNQLNNLSTLAEYGILCGVSRAAIHLRVRHKDPARRLPSVEVDGLELARLLSDNPAIGEARPKLAKAVQDAAAAGRGLLMVDHEANPPRKRTTGRRPVPREKVGTLTRKVMELAKTKGYKLERRSYGYHLLECAKPTHQREPFFCKNLGEVRLFLEDKPVVQPTPEA